MAMLVSRCLRMPLGTRLFSTGQKVCRVAILGTPNAGKSVLVNKIVESKVSAASPKRHTTRQEILGVLTEQDTQMIIMDTPGVVAAKDQNVYESTLVRSPWESLKDADVALVVIDAAKRLYDAEKQMLKRLGDMQKENQDFPFFLALNKVDLVRPKEKLLAICEHVNEQILFDLTHFICAETGYGVSELVLDLLDKAKPGEWPFPPEVRTDQSIGQRIEQILREKIFTRFHQELPYELEQRVEDMEVSPEGTVHIRHMLIAKTSGQKRILQGKTGGRLKDIEREAGDQINNILGRPVKLSIHVKTKSSKQ